MSSLFVVPESPATALHRRFVRKIEVNSALSRALVSYQSNRGRAKYRWFKYKEGFSAGLVEYLLAQFRIDRGMLLDPFAGCGAALFVAQDHGLSSQGIELLPVGASVIRARLLAEQVCPRDFKRVVRQVADGVWRQAEDETLRLQHLRITAGAFPPATERSIAQFRTFLRDKVKDNAIRAMLDLACLSILESVGFTRKDGQYLRWDSRAPRQLSGKPFSKGPVLEFETALMQRLREMADDLDEPTLFPGSDRDTNAEIVVHEGSCLHVLPRLPSASCDVLVTSPPYCNRYDYTRTYALELAYLGVDEVRLKELRQALLSCTVENHSKRDSLQEHYAGLGRAGDFNSALAAFERQDALQEILRSLEQKSRNGELNNPNVPRMVRNYFLESAVTIFEWARVMAPGGRVAVVNDNVRYAGIEVPVDLILCDLAEQAGFETEHICALARGKGNSSQQMGAHGRSELRKCVYLWRRP